MSLVGKSPAHEPTRDDVTSSEPHVAAPGRRTRSGALSAPRASAFDGAVWEDAGAAGESSADGWVPAPRVVPMEATAERETDITSVAQFEARDGTPGRRTVGVGERVTLTSGKPGAWTASEVGKGAAASGQGGTYHWIAPDRAGRVTITLTPPKESPQTITFEVVEPQDIEFEFVRDATPAELENMPIGAGMITKLSFLPTTVSFAAAEWREIGGGPSNVKGIFERVTPPDHVPNPKAIPMNRAHDLAAFFKRTLPSGGGSFDWEIPNTFQVKGGAPKEFVKSVQTVKLADPPLEGYVTVSKRGAATAPINSTMRGPNGRELPRQITKADDAGAKGDGLDATPLATADGDGRDGSPKLDGIARGDGLDGTGTRKVDDKTPAPAPATDDPALDDPGRVPPEFQTLADKGIIALLARSRDEGHYMHAPGVKFWDNVRAISAAQLHTIVQIHRGALAAGLWPMIDKLVGVYTYATSWGVHFAAKGDPRALTTNGEWGCDHPQWLVASQHPGGGAYEWFRQNTGAGNPGLHLGVGKSGNVHDVHWDPTNPMESVSDGKVGLGLPLPGAPMVPLRWAPKGWAIYSERAAAEHMLEIKGVIPPSKNANANKTYTSVARLEGFVETVDGFAAAEEAARPKTSNVDRSKKAVARLRELVAEIKTLGAPLKSLAMQDDAAVAPQLTAIRERATRTEDELYQALANLFAHGKAEAPRGQTYDYDKPAKWRKLDGHLYSVRPWFDELVSLRSRADR